MIANGIQNQMPDIQFVGKCQCLAELEIFLKY